MSDSPESKKPSPVGPNNVERDGLDYPLYQESSRPPDAIGTNPEDGMPQQIPATSVEDSKAPPLTVETFICMADTSEFVIRGGHGVIDGRYDPAEVERLPNGLYMVRVPEDQKLTGAEIRASAISPTEEGFKLFEVQPKRQQCAHYMRQLVPWQDNPEHKTCQRYCAALKNEQGELLSLANQQILACELRDPFDAESEALIDEFDRVIMLKGQQEESEFDVDAALKNENLGVLGDKK